jgi:hypothetical protein
MPRRESIPRIADRIAVEMARLEAQVARLRHMDELLEKTSREATGIKHSTRSRLGKLAIKHYRLNSDIFLSVAILNRLERANSPGGNYELG